MNEKFTQLNEKFCELEVRVRLLVTFAGALLIGLLIDLAWLSPSSNELSRIETEAEQFEKQIQDTLNAQAALNASIRDQKNHPKRKQLNRLKAQTIEAKALLEEKTAHLVSPAEMTSVLRDIITGTKNLDLVSLTKSQPVPIFEETDDKKQESEPQIQLYQHSVEIVLKGSFSNAQKFVKSLEDMPQKVSFDQFQFSVESYPNSEVRLWVSTLSFDQKWIGG